MAIKVIAFDVFGTVLNMDSIPKQDIADYVHTVKDYYWQPLNLPPSWRDLKAHPDSEEGLRLLRQNYIVVAMTNGPVDLMVHLSKANRLQWDFIIPIQMAKVYKPKLDAYRVMFDLLKVNADECLMITANPTFGDIEASDALGMWSQIIRHPGRPATIIELAEQLAKGVAGE